MREAHEGIGRMVTEVLESVPPARELGGPTYARAGTAGMVAGTAGLVAVIAERARWSWRWPSRPPWRWASPASGRWASWQSWLGEPGLLRLRVRVWLSVLLLLRAYPTVYPGSSPTIVTPSPHGCRRPWPDAAITTARLMASSAKALAAPFVATAPTAAFR